MTRPARSVLNKHSQNCSLVLEGSEVKARLIAERVETNTPVHVDWIRFTCQLRNAPAPDVETLFPSPVLSSLENPLSVHEEENGSYEKLAFARLMRQLQQLPDSDFAPSAQAMQLAREVCETLGDGFSVASELRKGHDFYKHRWSIERNGIEVGWVGFLASGDSPRQSAQSKTIHVNLYGSACTFAKHGWRDLLANVIDDAKGVITRCDLALDFFDGLSGGMKRVESDYLSGLCDVMGKRPKCNMVGDWCNGKSRSFYIGSKEAGKQTNLYEKGHQLFGEKDASGWIRAELRYGNKLRVLSSDMLRRPQDYFSGASDWHAALLREAGAMALPEPVSCVPRLASETIEAEVTKNVRWLRDVAAPSLSLAFQHLGENSFLELVMGKGLPGRLRRFSLSEIKRAYGNAHNRVSKSECAGHAFVMA
ncbi:MAG: replication initiation factor domain-containing protein [Proteobacteria bacterium]|nr:replication initiation factor domain-containing protein [Pseudomonadota bacterium]